MSGENEHQDAGRIWITTISETDAEGVLADVYATLWRRRHGPLEDRVRALSLWPELLASRIGMERELKRGSSLGRRRREMIFTLAAALIGCHF